MSFMYNPFPFDDPKPINRPKLSEETINSIVTGGTPNVAKKFIAEIAAKVKSEGVIVGIDGFDFGIVDSNKETLKSGKEIDDMIEL